MIPSIEILAKQISTDLHASRKNGKSNPENPVRASMICSAYKEKFGWDIEDREIRAATKFLIENNVPVGSTLDGYYYVLQSSEWSPTIMMLMPKFLSIKNKIDRIKEMEKKMAAEEQGQMEMPILNVLNDGLDLEKIS